MKTIPSFPLYSAGDDGHIYRNGKRLKSRDNGHGYLHVFLRKDGKTHTRYVHRMVCEAYRGPCPDGWQCRHRDNVRSHNEPDNVEWATRKDNESDKVKFGTINRGERASHSVLTEDMVSIARVRAGNGERIDHLAAELCVNPGTLGDAITGKRWDWLSGAIPSFTTRRKFTDDQVRTIRSLAGRETEVAIAKRFGVGRSAIGLIIRRESYAHVLDLDFEEVKAG